MNEDSAPPEDAAFLESLDPARQALVRAMRARGLNYALLSRHLGRNITYVHQFVTKGTPRYLTDRDRRALSVLLGIPEQILQDPSDPDLTVPGEALDGSIKGFSGARPNDIPVFSEDGIIDPAQAVEWTARPTFLTNTVGNEFALWITRPHEGLRSGDLAYVRLTQPPRVGDMAVIVAARRIRAIGRLEGHDMDGAIVGGTRFPSEGHRLGKVAGALFA